MEAEKLIDLDTLLEGNPSWEQVVAFWKEGEFYGDKYFIPAVKKYLRTSEQQKALADADICLCEMMEGRYPMGQSHITKPIFKAWNKKLGFKAFNPLS